MNKLKIADAARRLAPGSPSEEIILSSGGMENQRALTRHFQYFASIYAATAKNGEDLTMPVEFTVDGLGNLAMRLESVQLIWIGKRPWIMGGT